MNYQQAEQYLFSLGHLTGSQNRQKPSPQIRQKRVALLLDALGNPEKKIPRYIHIAGTSGKGSVALMMHEILHANYHSSGLIISPHPTHLRERWRIGKRIMSQKSFCDIVQHIRVAIDSLSAQKNYEAPSFPEVCTVIGLYYFANEGVNIAVMETGVGGGLDSTNLIPHKEIAIITNIGLDHQHLLGETKKEIAKAKAGIITKHTTHAIIGESDPEIAKFLLAHAKRKNVPATHIPKSYISRVSHTPTRTSFHLYRPKIQSTSQHSTSMIGDHQAHNAALAFMASKELLVWESVIDKALTKVTHPLSFQRYSKKPLIILDGAHNADKITATASIAKQAYPEKRPVLMLALCANKPLSVLNPLLKLNPKAIICTHSTTNPFRKMWQPAAMATYLSKKTKKHQHIVIEHTTDPLYGLKVAKKHTNTDNYLLSTGSIFLSGQIRGILAKTRS